MCGRVCLGRCVPGVRSRQRTDRGTRKGSAWPPARAEQEACTLTDPRSKEPGEREACVGGSGLVVTPIFLQVIDILRGKAMRPAPASQPEPAPDRGATTSPESSSLLSSNGENPAPRARAQPLPAACNSDPRLSHLPPEPIRFPLVLTQDPGVGVPAPFSLDPVAGADPAPLSSTGLSASPPSSPSQSPPKDPPGFPMAPPNFFLPPSSPPAFLPFAGVLRTPGRPVPPSPAPGGS